MSYTPYSHENQEFSNSAHAIAEEQIYPFIFQAKREDLTFRNTGLMSGGDGKVLDGQMAVDWCVSVKTRRLTYPIEHSVQERFRKLGYVKHHDLTITEYNRSTKQPSELYKIKSGIFLYGYFDDQKSEITEWVAVNTTQLMIAIHSEAVDYDNGYNPRSNQDFITINFNQLYKAGLLIAYREEGKNPVLVYNKQQPEK